MIGEDKEGLPRKIPVGRLRRPAHPLRRPPDPDELRRLAASIRRHGLLHAILVRPVGKDFEIVSGLRRYLACRQLGWGEIPAVVRPMDDRQAVEVSLAENARREPFSAAEREDLLRRLRELYPARTPEELEEWLGPVPEAAPAGPGVVGLRLSLPGWMDEAAEAETKVKGGQAEEEEAAVGAAASVPAGPVPAERSWLIPVMTVILKELRATGELDMAFVRRVVDEIFDMFERLEPVEFLDLRCAEKTDRRLPRHCVNVAKLAVFLGRELGLGRAELEQAAICGLLHDAGMAREKDSILAGSPPEEQEEWRRTRGHPADGQILLTKEAVLRNVVARVAPDHAGGPPEGRKERVHLYARIVNVVDTYEALVHPRSDRPPLLPHRAMQTVMDAGARGMLDWDLVRLFVRAMSVYPIGSYIRLKGGELARVVRSNPEIPEKPVVAILTDAQGEALEEPVELDLAVAEPPPFEPVAGPA